MVSWRWRDCWTSPLKKTNRRFLMCRWPFQTWFSSRWLLSWKILFENLGRHILKRSTLQAILTEGSNILVGWTITTRNLYLVFGPLGVIDMFWSWEIILHIIITTTPKPTFRFRKLFKQTKTKAILFFWPSVLFFSFSLGGVGGGWTFIRQDVLGSILADSMLSMSSEPSQPGAHDTADHFTGWVGRMPKGEDGEGFREGGRVPGFNKKKRGQDWKDRMFFLRVFFLLCFFLCIRIIKGFLILS